jgi:hypothetical protein
MQYIKTIRIIAVGLHQQDLIKGLVLGGLDRALSRNAEDRGGHTVAGTSRSRFDLRGRQS